jgi:hypothetical protein
VAKGTYTLADVPATSQPKNPYTIADGALQDALVSMVSLPEGWIWNDPTQVITAGAGTYLATYPPLIDPNYEDPVFPISLDASACIPAKEVLGIIQNKVLTAKTTWEGSPLLSYAWYQDQTLIDSTNWKLPATPTDGHYYILLFTTDQGRYGTCRIQADLTTPLASPPPGIASGEAQIFNIHGKSVRASLVGAPPGIYIIRQGSATQTIVVR